MPLTGGDNYLRKYQDGAKRGFDVVSLIVKTGAYEENQKHALSDIARPRRAHDPSASIPPVFLV